jgi:4-hydroxy-2-oxoheptanedioate aldolase
VLEAPHQRLYSFRSLQMLPGTNLSRTLCRSGASWILVDCEHGQISDDSMHESVTAIAACAVSPIVRIPAAESWMIKRALDSGAHGIMCPLLQTVQDAENLVRNSKFPPLGKRGYGSPFSMGSFVTGNTPAPTQVDYLHQANSTLLTIIQIETKEALENVDAIAAVPGVDVLFIGPFDLGNNIGHPILTGEQDPELKAAIEKIRVAAKKAGKWCGIYCSSGAQAKMYADQGFDMANVTNDVMALSAHFSTQYADAKGVSGVKEVATGPYGR